MRKIRDLKGLKLGRLKVIRIVDMPNKKDKYWESICDCGSTHICTASSLNTGRTKSCGCLQRQRSKEKVTHGEASINSKTKEYRTWQGIKTRCYNNNEIGYLNYGGRGIKMCKRWLNSYENFLADMGRAPSKKHSIERKNINGNYTPSNCIWATALVQMNNKSTTVWIEFRGQRKSISNWCRDLGVSRTTVYQRIHKLKWDVETALTT